MSSSSHPFDQHLGWIASETHRVTAGEVAALDADQHLNITLLVPVRDPVVCIDLCARRVEHGGPRPARPARARDAGRCS